MDYSYIFPTAPIAATKSTIDIGIDKGIIESTLIFVKGQKWAFNIIILQDVSFAIISCCDITKSTLSQ